MSRILLLVPFLLWMAFIPTRGWQPGAGTVADTVLFLGFYIALVAGLGLWSRLLARRVRTDNLHASLGRYNVVMFAARWLVPVWFGVGLFVLEWGEVVTYALGAIARWPVQLPAVLAGTLPALLAWCGLWWAQFPADRAMREQSMLARAYDDLPIHAPPTLRKYLAANLRLQMLFAVIPVLLIFTLRDLFVVIGYRVDAVRDLLRQSPAIADLLFSLAATTVVVLVAPEVLRRILRTEPLPASPLRAELEAMCRRAGIGYRDILLWRTDGNLGNAAVMGLLPRVRYVLLSDVLLETMTDEEIQAVFAHEAGHIIHRHMTWYAVAIVILMLMMAGPGELLAEALRGVRTPTWMPMELLLTVAGLALFLVGFGYLSRRFERQADVFAARTMEAAGAARSRQAAMAHVVPQSAPLAAMLSAAAPQYFAAPLPSAGTGHPSSVRAEASTYVGAYGAAIFANALRRVAAVNNIPTSVERPPRNGSRWDRIRYTTGRFTELSNSWFHGTIPSRMDYIRQLGADPDKTRQFDRFMGRLYAAMLILLCTFGAWTASSVAKVSRTSDVEWRQ